MVKKTNLLLLLLLVFGAFSAPFVLAEEPWDTIKSIATLEFMSKLGFQASLDPFEGFIRFAIFLVLFAVLFRLAELLKLGRNTSIVISLVLSLVSALFIPGSVLVAAGTGYGTVVGMVLLALPLVLFAWGYFTVENRWARVGIMALALFLLYQMDGHIDDVASGAGAAGSQHFQGVVETVADYIDYVIWLAWGLLIVAVFSAFGSAGGASEHHPNWLGRVKDKALSRFAGTEKGKELRHERIEETRLLNDIAIEKEELGLLEDAQKRLQAYIQIALGEMNRHGRVESKAHLDSLKSAHAALNKALIDDANRVQHKWNRAQRRETAEFQRLLRELVSRGVNVTKLKAQEQTILNAFVVVSRELKDAQRVFQSIKSHHDIIVRKIEGFYSHHSYPTPSTTTITDTDPIVFTVPTLSDVKTAFDKIDAKMSGVINPLDRALRNEEDAVDRTATLAKEIHDKWTVA